MLGSSKNIRTRKRIRDALPGMPSRFSAYEMSLATGLSPNRVVGLLKGMCGVVKHRVGSRGAVWEVVSVGGKVKCPCGGELHFREGKWFCLRCCSEVKVKEEELDDKT